MAKTGVYFYVTGEKKGRKRKDGGEVAFSILLFSGRRCLGFAVGTAAYPVLSEAFSFGSVIFFFCSPVHFVCWQAGGCKKGGSKGCLCQLRFAEGGSGESASVVVEKRLLSRRPGKQTE